MDEEEFAEKLESIDNDLIEANDQIKILTTDRDNALEKVVELESKVEELQEEIADVEKERDEFKTALEELHESSCSSVESMKAIHQEMDDQTGNIWKEIESLDSATDESAKLI